MHEGPRNKLVRLGLALADAQKLTDGGYLYPSHIVQAEDEDLLEVLTESEMARVRAVFEQVVELS